MIASGGGATSLLPAGSGAFLARRLGETAGLALAVLAGVLGAALMTYSSADPSFNTAAEGEAANLIGRPGSYAADLLLQWLGLAAALPPLILAAWSWALLSHRGLSLPAARIALAPLAVLLAAVGCAALGAPGWPIAAGAGGVAGGALLATVGDSLMTIVNYTFLK